MSGRETLQKRGSPTSLDKQFYRNCEKNLLQTIWDRNERDTILVSGSSSRMASFAWLPCLCPWWFGRFPLQVSRYRKCSKDTNEEMMIIVFTGKGVPENLRALFMKKAVSMKRRFEALSWLWSFCRNAMKYTSCWFRYWSCNLLDSCLMIWDSREDEWSIYRWWWSSSSLSQEKDEEGSCCLRFVDQRSSSSSSCKCISGCSERWGISVGDKYCYSFKHDDDDERRHAYSIEEKDGWMTLHVVLIKYPWWRNIKPLLVPSALHSLRRKLGNRNRWHSGHGDHHPLWVLILCNPVDSWCLLVVLNTVSCCGRRCCSRSHVERVHSLYHWLLVLWLCHRSFRSWNQLMYVPESMFHLTYSCCCQRSYSLNQLRHHHSLSFWFAFVPCLAF